MWTNDDELNVKFYREQGNTGIGGSYRTAGALQETEIKFEKTDVSSALAVLGRARGLEGIYLPKGAFIERVDLVAEAAVTSSGNGSTLTVGLLKAADETTYDADGLVATLDWDNTAAGTGLGTLGNRLTIAKGSTAAGSAIGVALTEAVIIGANYGTEAPTNGKVALRVYWYNPQTTG